MTAGAGSDGRRVRERRWPRTWLRVIALSPVLAALLLAVVWFGVPAELRDAMTRGGTWHTSATGLVFAASGPAGRSRGLLGPSPPVSLRRDTARGYYSALRTLEWERGSPDADFAAVARKVANSLAQRDVVFYGSDRSPKTMALAETDVAFAPLTRWASSWSSRTYVFLLPDPPQPPVVASAVLRPEWLATPAELASLEATSTPDYLWKLKHRSEHPTFLRLESGPEEGFVGGVPRVLTTRLAEHADDLWLSVWMLPGGVWLEEAGGGYWSEGPLEPPAVSVAGTLSPTTAEYQAMLGGVALAYKANVWVLGPLRLRAVPQVVPEGVTVAQAGLFGDSVLRASAAPGGGDVLNYPLSEIPRPERAYASGGRYQVLAQVVGTSPSVSESTPQTMLFVATWAENPYPPLRVGRLLSAWDEIRAWFAAGQSISLVVCFVLLGATLVASPVAFVADRRATERERVAAEMARVQRDAHDRVYNRMAALSMRLEAESSTTSDPEASAAFAAVAAELADTRRDLREILGDARVSSAEQATKSADSCAMAADQLAALVAAQQSMLGIEIDFRVDPDLPPIAPEAGWDLQCITEEAISNAVRHGRASAVTVALAGDPAGIRLEIADNGKAAHATDIERLPASSTGLRGMRARAERLGGSLELLWEPIGTTVIVRIPEHRQRGR